MHEILYNTFFKGSLLGYLFEVIFTAILFDILGVEKGYAFVPYYKKVLHIRKLRNVRKYKIYLDNKVYLSIIMKLIIIN